MGSGSLMAESKNNQETATKLESEALNRAIKKLSIQGVFLTNSESFINEAFSPAGFKAEEHQSQGFTRRLHVGLDEQGLDYGFNIAVGLRTIRKDEADKAKNSENNEFVCLEVKAQFLAIYKASEALTDEEQEAFHRNNVLYHVWPYWREFVQQMGWRMGAPFMAVPMLKSLPTLN